MADAFCNLVPEARAFLANLAQNNSREWFQANKEQYDAQLKRPALLLLDQIAADLGKMTGQQVSTKLFRPNRDVRFSKDKTPYHEHLHMLWTTQGVDRQPLGWFFGISPKYISIGAGQMAFEKKAITLWRTTIDGPHGRDFETLIQTLKANGFRIDPPELKRVPSPYAKDHPREALLRRKSLAVWQEFRELPEPTHALKTTFKALQPLAKLLYQLT